MAETSAMVPFFFNFALRCYCLQLLNCLLYHIATNSFGLQIFMTIFTACIYCTVLPTSSWRIPWLHWSVSASNSSFGVTIWPAWSHEVYLFRTLPFAASRVILFTFSCVFFNSTSHNFSIIWSRRFSLKALPAYCLHKRICQRSPFASMPAGEKHGAHIYGTLSAARKWPFRFQRDTVYTSSSYSFRHQEGLGKYPGLPRPKNENIELSIEQHRLQCRQSFATCM